jgi:hypothetical protein
MLARDISLSKLTNQEAMMDETFAIITVDADNVDSRGRPSLTCA